MVASWRQVTEEPLPALGHTNATFFEALLVRGVEAPIELKTALLGIDVDLECLRPKYPSTTFVAAIDLARSYLYGESASKEVGDRELGRTFFAGFLRTLPGRLLGAALPLMGMRRFLQLAGRYVRIGRDDLTVEVELGPPGEARVLVVDPATARPYFFVGSLEAALDRLPERHRLTVHAVDAWRFEVHLTWRG